MPSSAISGARFCEGFIVLQPVVQFAFRSLSCQGFRVIDGSRIPLRGATSACSRHRRRSRRIPLSRWKTSPSSPLARSDFRSRHGTPPLKSRYASDAMFICNAFSTVERQIPSFDRFYPAIWEFEDGSIAARFHGFERFRSASLSASVGRIEKQCTKKEGCRDWSLSLTGMMCCALVDQFRPLDARRRA
jgi:hypothetical protein